MDKKNVKKHLPVFTRVDRFNIKEEGLKNVHSYLVYSQLKPDKRKGKT